MKRAIIVLVRIAVLLLLLPAALPAGGKYWIAFTDKGAYRPAFGPLAPGSDEERAAAATLTPRALERRAKVLPPGDRVSAADLPIAETYLDRLRSLGVEPVCAVRWMNAVSAELDDAQRSAVLALPFVRDVVPVRALRTPAMPPDQPSAPVASKTAALDYGNSFTQVQMIDATLLHALGITGKGTLVGMLDTGARWRLHEALRTRDVVAEHDFINNDDVTANEPGDVSAQDTHGTLTFSVIAGYRPGRLIGAAYGASYIIAKTEYFPAEVRAEEDRWAAAIEWMEGLGADVVSSSVGYDVFDDQTGYFWASGDFDGRTSVTARAAVRAARLGVTVVTSMGNEGNGDGVTGTMLTPADADSIISAGAVSFSRYLSSVSGTGPTNDGRTKPDLVAPGVGVYCAVPGTASYSTASGTSLASPLVAGAAALLLSVRPELTPIEVRDILRSTADTIDALNYPVRPNNFTGWGLVQAAKAILTVGPVFSNVPTVGTTGFHNTVTIMVASGAPLVDGSVLLRYAAPGDDVSVIPMTLDSLMIEPNSGRYRAELPSMALGTVVQFSIEASDSQGRSYTSPPPVRATTWQLRSGYPGLVEDEPTPSVTALGQNFPNPFLGVTSIPFRVGATSEVSCVIYDLLGREVETLFRTMLPAGDFIATWKGSGRPSGVYFCRLSAGGTVLTRKMILLR
jgi:subtilisin family serine protease